MALIATEASVKLDSVSTSIPSSAVEVYLAARPTTTIVPEEHFGLRSVSLPPPSALRKDELLVRVLWTSADPAMRGWISPSKRSYVGPVTLGAAMRAYGIGRALTAGPNVPRGALVTGMLGWRSVAVVRARALSVAPSLPSGVPVSALLGALGGTGLTAYFGLLRVGMPKKGNTVVVSAAAGATGGVVVQIAKHVLGCRVTGVAGGARKCAYVRDTLGADECVDYRGEDFAKKLRDAVGKRGADVYFDNVGGPVLEAALGVIRDGARVVLCGAISVYNKRDVRGPRNYLALVARRAKMEGFIVTDFTAEFPKALSHLAGWIRDGKIVVREDVVEGLEHAPEALLRLFSGKNIGKVVIRVHADDGNDIGANGTTSIGRLRRSKL